MSDKSHARWLCGVLAVMLGGELALAQPDHLKFELTNIDSGVDALTAVTIGPDGHVYFSELDGDVYRHEISRSTGLPPGSRQLLYNGNDRYTIGLEFSPEATADNLDAFVTYTPDDGSRTSAVARMTLPSVGDNTLASRSDVIVGLPFNNNDHTTNQMDFGPDGRMYFNVGSNSGAGGNERPLSAATLVADVLAPNFGTIDVHPDTGYDHNAIDAPVKIFASGVRNAYDLVWHSNGELYTAINGNDGGGSTPQDPDNQQGTQVVSKPDEQLALLREGLYYGHPNPERGEYISHAGNPTAGVDSDWELADYPVGTQPEPGWDDSLNYNLLDNTPYDQQFGTVSPNGIAEYAGNTGLQESLLVAFFRFGNQDTAIQVLELNETTGLVETVGSNPILDEDGDTLFVTSALDLVVDKVSGRIYVAGHGDGNLYLLDPVADASPDLAGDYNDDGVVDIADYTVWRDNLGAPHGTLPNDADGGAIGIAQYNTFVNNFGALAATSFSTAHAATPEPASSVLTLLGCCLSGGRRCRAS